MEQRHRECTFDCQMHLIYLMILSVASMRHRTVGIEQAEHAKEASDAGLSGDSGKSRPFESHSARSCVQ